MKNGSLLALGVALALGGLSCSDEVTHTRRVTETTYQAEQPQANKRTVILDPDTNTRTVIQERQPQAQTRTTRRVETWEQEED